MKTLSKISVIAVVLLSLGSLASCGTQLNLDPPRTDNSEIGRNAQQTATKQNNPVFNTNNNNYYKPKP